jgi:hypothetical protein
MLAFVLLLISFGVARPVNVTINVNGLVFVAELQWTIAPATCLSFVAALPLSATALQARWSGEAGWVPLGNETFGITATENETSSPLPGQLLFYPKGISETEILLPFGVSRFGSKFGPLFGTPFLTIVEGQQNYAELAHRLEWSGAQTIQFH